MNPSSNKIANHFAIRKLKTGVACVAIASVFSISVHTTTMDVSAAEVDTEKSEVVEESKDKESAEYKKALAEAQKQAEQVKQEAKAIAEKSEVVEESKDKESAEYKKALAEAQKQAEQVKQEAVKPVEQPTPEVVEEKVEIAPEPVKAEVKSDDSVQDEIVEIKTEPVKEQVEVQETNVAEEVTEAVEVAPQPVETKSVSEPVKETQPEAVEVENVKDEVIDETPSEKVEDVTPVNKSTEPAKVEPKTLKQDSLDDNIVNADVDNKVKVSKTSKTTESDTSLTKTASTDKKLPTYEDTPHLKVTTGFEYTWIDENGKRQSAHGLKPGDKDHVDVDPDKLNEYVSDKHVNTLQKWQRDHLKQVNDLRAEHGKSALKLSPELSEFAYIRALDMYLNSYFGHDKEGVGTVKQQYDAIYGTDGQPQGYYKWGGMGENITMDFRSTANDDLIQAESFSNFHGSPGHFENMIHDDYAFMGLGFVSGGLNERHKFVQIFHRDPERWSEYGAFDPNADAVIESEKNNAATEQAKQDAYNKALADAAAEADRVAKEAQAIAKGETGQKDTAKPNAKEPVKKPAKDTTVLDKASNASTEKTDTASQVDREAKETQEIAKVETVQKDTVEPNVKETDKTPTKDAVVLDKVSNTSTETTNVNDSAIDSIKADVTIEDGGSADSESKVSESNTENDVVDMSVDKAPLVSVSSSVQDTVSNDENDADSVTAIDMSSNNGPFDGGSTEGSNEPVNNIATVETKAPESQPTNAQTGSSSLNAEESDQVLPHTGTAIGNTSNYIMGGLLALLAVIATLFARRVKQTKNN